MRAKRVKMGVWGLENGIRKMFHDKRPIYLKSGIERSKELQLMEVFPGNLEIF